MVFLNIFAFFLEFSIVRRVGMKRNDNFCFGLKRNHKRFFNFLKFFAIFLEFSITRWVGTKRNDIFYFLYFSTFFNLFWLEMKLQWYFLIFLNFLIFFWNFLLPVRLEGNGTKTFIFLVLGLSQPILA